MGQAWGGIKQGNPICEETLSKVQTRQSPIRGRVKTGHCRADIKRGNPLCRTGIGQGKNSVITYAGQGKKTGQSPGIGQSKNREIRVGMEQGKKGDPLCGGGRARVKTG